VDDIRTNSNQLIKECRKTAWEGDEGVAPFAYAGKAMPRKPWSPVVRAVRDRLVDETLQYYDGCLLNLYPDGGSGMRYHIDPDQGTLWDYDTAVVSVGATRRFAFREIDSHTSQPYNFVLMHGDVTSMFGDCQERYQHTVKKADNKRENAARASFVYKRKWNYKG
jgi:alkylated DNA repair dioxygenase AlkB